MVERVVEEEELDSNTLRRFVEEEDVKSGQRALEAKFDVNSADAEGVTPLCLALRKENYELIELLQEYNTLVRFIKTEHWQDLCENIKREIVQLTENDGNLYVRLIELAEGHDYPERSLQCVGPFTQSLINN